MKVHCLFEQSGTFKNEFKKLGHEAYDYDIQNEFGQTDFVVDLFEEIRGGYDGKPSIFDNIRQDDLIMAFFPCVRFENQIMLSFRGQAKQFKKWTDIQKIEYDMKLIEELKDNYLVVCKLFVLCHKKKLKLIMENPYSEEHFLRRYWCIEPKVIDRDRTERGDYFKKPTQYWFVNIEPKYNFIFEPQNYNVIGGKDPRRRMTPCMQKQLGIKGIKTCRSMIHSDYANRFIREFILEQE